MQNINDNLKSYVAVEELVFTVSPAFVEEFIRIDHEIWTLMLAKYDGFISKETWINDDAKGEVSTIIYWESIDKWKAIPESDLIVTGKLFDDTVGKDNYKFKCASHEGNQKYKVFEYVN